MINIPAGCYEIASTWWVAGADLGFGDALNGEAQFITGLAPRWACTLQYRIPLTTSAAREWEAMISGLEGRQNPLTVVPKPSRLHSSVVIPGISFTGGVTFDGGVKMVSGPPKLSYYAPARARIIRVGDTESLRAGLFVFIAGTCHQIVAKSGDLVTIAPPLRAQAPAGTELAKTGAVQMVRRDPQAGVLSRGPDGYADATLELVETIR